MICVVWFLSALVSLPTLLYPPWRIPFVKPSHTKIHLHELDKNFLDSVNGTKELAHHKCQVTTFLIFCIFVCSYNIIWIGIPTPWHLSYYRINAKIKTHFNNIDAFSGMKTHDFTYYCKKWHRRWELWNIYPNCSHINVFT